MEGALDGGVCLYSVALDERAGLDVCMDVSERFDFAVRVDFAGSVDEGDMDEVAF